MAMCRAGFFLLNCNLEIANFDKIVIWRLQILIKLSFGDYNFDRKRRGMF